MVDTYSKLLGLSDSPTPPADSVEAKPANKPTFQEKNTRLPTNQQTSKLAKKQIPQAATTQIGTNTSTSLSPTPSPEKKFDTSLLTTKEKTKYGTYLTDESIENIRIRAIQTKRDDHQIVQEAVNQYFERLKNSLLVNKQTNKHI
jgi:hypothetical protein